MEKIMDARGMACPLPVVNAKKTAEAMKNGDLLTVLVDNEIAVQNLKRFADHKGYPVADEVRGEKEFAVIMQIMADGNAEAEAEHTICEAEERKKSMVVVLSSDAMGTGDEKLGRALMKAFVFALTRQDILPETILCYNGGARLTCEGADTLEDFRALETEGVRILTCGTCLDFYGLKETLAVGAVTNMYEIVEIMETAGTIVRP